MTHKPLKADTNTVLFTLDSFETGGVTSFVRLYTRAIKSMGWQSIIIGYQGDITSPSIFFKDSQVVVIDKTIQTSFWHRCVGIFQYTQTLNHLYRSNTVTLVHLSTTWSTIYALFCPFTWRLKRLSTFYGAYHLEEQSERTHDTMLKEKLGDIVKKNMQYIGLIFSHEIITFSQYASSVIRNNFPWVDKRRIHIIPGFVPSGAILSRYSIPKPSKKPLSLINIGRAEPRKGMKLLLQTAALLKSKNIPFSLTIAGPVYYYQAFDTLKIYEELRLLDSVRILHSVNGDDKEKLFKQANLFIMPSLSLETFGLSVIESLARGVPVIVTPTGALPEIMSNIHPKFISSDTTPNSIAKRIIWYSRLSTKQKQNLKQKCLDVTQAEYSDLRWQNTVISLYKNLAQNPHQTS